MMSIELSTGKSFLLRTKKEQMKKVCITLWITFRTKREQKSGENQGGTRRAGGTKGEQVLTSR